MIFDFLQHLPTLSYPLKALLILTSGVVILRITGKRSVTQMTIPEVVFMISIGTILIQPLGLKREWNAVYGGLLLAVGLVVLSKIQLWFPRTRRYIFGLPTILINDGKMDMEELKKARITTDDLEMRLRMLKVGNIKDVEMGILEPSGRLTVSLKPEKIPATKEDIQSLKKDIQEIMEIISSGSEHMSQNNTKQQVPPLFNEAYQEAETKEYKKDTVH